MKLAIFIIQDYEAVVTYVFLVKKKENFQNWIYNA